MTLEAFVTRQENGFALVSKDAAVANMRRLRILAGMSQQELGGKFGWTRQAVSAAEKGHRALTLDEVDQIAGAFGISPARLIEAEPCPCCDNMPPAGMTCGECGVSGPAFGGGKP